MGLFKKNLKNKGIHLYVAVLREKPKNFLTITLTEDEALEYIKQVGGFEAAAEFGLI